MYLVYGPITGSLDLAYADAKFLGEAASDYAGNIQSSRGDLDGDGLDDLLIGAYANDAGGSNAGAVYVFYAGE